MLSAKILIFLLALDLVLTNPINPEYTSAESKEISIKTSKQRRARDDDSEDNLNSISSEESNFEIPRFGFQGVPREPTVYLQPSYYNLVEYPHVKTSRIGVSNYRGVLYQYAKPEPRRLSYIPEYNVKSLPPVISTYIHGLLPTEESPTRYSLDTLNSISDVYVPRVVRQPRMLRDADEEFLAQLRHDAIMNNIIPTMQVPFARYAAVATPTAGSSVSASGIGASESSNGMANGEISAVYPMAGAGGFPEPVPILFSCVPKITRGAVRVAYNEEASQLNQPAPVYRSEAEMSKSAAAVEKSTPIKVDLVPKKTEAKPEN